MTERHGKQSLLNPDQLLSQFTGEALAQEPQSPAQALYQFTREEFELDPIQNPLAGKILHVRPDNMPPALKASPNWLLWGAREDVGRISKPPFCVRYGQLSLARVNAKSDRGSFEDALNNLRLFKDKCFTSTETDRGTGEIKTKKCWISGIGFVLTKESGLIGIDIDHILPGPTAAIPQEVDPVYRGFVERLLALGTYLEISPSGTGLRAFLVGELPRSCKGRGVELYSQGRYLTLTGWQVSKQTPSYLAEVGPDAQGLLDDMIDFAKAKPVNPTPDKKKDATEKPTKKEGGKKKALRGAALLEELEKSDPYLIDFITRKERKHGIRFDDLFYRGHEEKDDKSSNDMTLACLFAQYTDDPARIDRLMRQSALLSSPDRLQKWDTPHHADGKTYGAGTVEKAIQGTQKTPFLRWLKGQTEKRPAPLPQLDSYTPLDTLSEEEFAAETSIPQNRSTIEVAPGARPAIAAKIAATFSNGNVYQKNGVLYRVKKLTQNIERSGVIICKNSAVTEIMNEETIKHEAETRIEFVKYDGKTGFYNPCDLPTGHAKAVLALPGFPRVRELRGIARTPLITPEGQILDKPGYDRRTGLLFLLDPDSRGGRRSC